MNSASCPLCSGKAGQFREVQSVDYFHCRACVFIFADPALLAKADCGEFFREYADDYWQEELPSARTRAFGSSLARLGETVLYTRIPINRFIDIGTGPGYLLDAIAAYLPDNSHHFYGVEKYPPPERFRSMHKNYHCTSLEDLGLEFQAGTCVEVLEHLTPSMARGLAKSIASVSVPGSLFLFNTGLVDYVLKEDPGYLDPYGRGHITSWSVSAARQVFGPEGFTTHAIRGKSWAFAIEFTGKEQRNPDRLEDRIWHAPAENIALLNDRTLGDVMYILGRESARAY